MLANYVQNFFLIGNNCLPFRSYFSLHCNEELLSICICYPLEGWQKRCEVGLVPLSISIAISFLRSRISVSRKTLFIPHVLYPIRWRAGSFKMKRVKSRLVISRPQFHTKSHDIRLFSFPSQMFIPMCAILHQWRNQQRKQTWLNDRESNSFRNQISWTSHLRFLLAELYPKSLSRSLRIFPHYEICRWKERNTSW